MTIQLNYLKLWGILLNYNKKKLTPKSIKLNSKNKNYIKIKSKDSKIKIKPLSNKLITQKKKIINS